ncbi:hypothetical protein C2S51_019176 [Perilla frutescens var. frutescens]|nr:hypothetical protein C2S51_019176 [Perilla frutescens var. frutescens]
MTQLEALPSYHLYGPMWALQIWAYETIPTLGREAAHYAYPNSIPRMLAWKFSTSSELDFGFIFGPEFSYLEMMVSANEAEQDYYMSIQRGEIFGVRFLIVENPMHPRQVRDGRPVLFRKAANRRHSENASVQIEEVEEDDEEEAAEEVFIQQPQTRTGGKGKSVSHGESSGQLDRLKTHVIHHIDTVVAPKITKDVVSQMKGMIKLMFGSIGSFRSKSKSRGGDEATSRLRDASARHSVSMHDRHHVRSPERDPSRHSVSMYDRHHVRCPEREPSRHSMTMPDQLARRALSHQPHLDLQLQLQSRYQPQPQPEFQLQPQFSPTGQFFGDSGEFVEFYNQLQPHEDNAQPSNFVTMQRGAPSNPNFPRGTR